MAADNHLIQLASPGLQGPERSHWPTYDRSISIVNHIGLHSLHIVADHRVYRSSYSSTKVALMLAAGTTTLCDCVKGVIEKDPIHSLIEAGSHKSGRRPLLVPLPERDLLQPACRLPLPLHRLSPSFIFTPLSLPLSFFPFLPFWLPTFPLFHCVHPILTPSPSQCHWGSSTHHSLVVTQTHTAAANKF